MDMFQLDRTLIRRKKAQFSDFFYDTVEIYLLKQMV